MRRRGGQAREICPVPRQWDFAPFRRRAADRAPRAAARFRNSGRRSGVGGFAGGGGPTGSGATDRAGSCPGRPADCRSRPRATSPRAIPGRPRRAAGADLVDAPVDLEDVVVGVEKLDRDLAAGAPASVEDDLHAVGLQVRARPHHLVEARDLEGEMVELVAVRGPAGAADERHAVMVGVAAQERHAAGHHGLGIDVRDLETEDPGVEVDRPPDVLHHQHHVADLPDLEGHPRGRRRIAERANLRRLHPVMVDHASRHGSVPPCRRAGRGRAHDGVDSAGVSARRQTLPARRAAAPPAAFREPGLPARLPWRRGQALARSSAWSRSARMSSMCSIPTDSRT